MEERQEEEKRKGDPGNPGGDESVPYLDGTNRFMCIYILVHFIHVQFNVSIVCQPFSCCSVAMSCLTFLKRNDHVVRLCSIKL